MEPVIITLKDPVDFKGVNFNTLTVNPPKAKLFKLFDSKKPEGEVLLLMASAMADQPQELIEELSWHDWNNQLLPVVNDFLEKSQATGNK